MGCPLVAGALPPRGGGYIPEVYCGHLPAVVLYCLRTAIMQALGLSPLEMRQIIELEFLPLKCECLEEEGGSFRVQIHNPQTGLCDLCMSGISRDRFASSRAILQLVGELRRELQHETAPHAKAS